MGGGEARTFIVHLPLLRTCAALQVDPRECIKEEVEGEFAPSSPVHNVTGDVSQAHPFSVKRHDERWLGGGTDHVCSVCLCWGKD